MFAKSEEDSDERNTSDIQRVRNEFRNFLAVFVTCIA